MGLKGKLALASGEEQPKGWRYPRLGDLLDKRQ